MSEPSKPMKFDLMTPEEESMVLVKTCLLCVLAILFGRFLAQNGSPSVLQVSLGIGMAVMLWIASTFSEYWIFDFQRKVLEFHSNFLSGRTVKYSYEFEQLGMVAVTGHKVVDLNKTQVEKWGYAISVLAEGKLHRLSPFGLDFDSVSATVRELQKVVGCPLLEPEPQRYVELVGTTLQYTDSPPAEEAS